MSESDLARSRQPRPIEEIGRALGLADEEVVPYGRYKAKIALSVLERLTIRPHARYVLVTAINPTPLGEGKTTTAIGLTDALSQMGHRAVVTLRQPSLGPVFGIKGGGTGGGRAQVIPMEAINLHLTGDAHAVGTAHNLLSAFLENHLYHGNPRGLDPRRLFWPRAMSVSDRALRRVQVESSGQGPAHTAQFVITEASEIMAILALTNGVRDLRQRLARIIVGMTSAGHPITAEDLKCAGAMAVLLQEALGPNLVQTLEGSPAIVHAGPFANIAHGNCSVLADAVAQRCADYVVTEAGFGSDLGAEKFFHIKCRTSGLRPHAAVIVATLRALKVHGGGGVMQVGAPLPISLTGPNPDALANGLPNLQQHIDNIRAFGVPAIVALNAFRDDPEEELRQVQAWALDHGASGAAVSTHWTDGGKGAEDLARTVLRACVQAADFRPLYEPAQAITAKIEIIARRIYGAANVSYEPSVRAQIEEATRLGFGSLPICMAKTPLSLSHDPSLKGRPTGFTLPIKELRILAGADFLTVLCSGIRLMPGLPKRPLGEEIDLDPKTGEIVGLA